MRTFTRPIALLMSFSVCLIVPFGALAAPVRPTATSPADRAARQSIQAAYNREDAAVADKNLSAVWAGRTPDYEYINLRGVRRTVAQLRPEMARLFAVSGRISGRSVVQRLNLRGNVASALVLSQGTIVLPDVRTGRDVVMKINGTYADTWVKRGNIWLKRRSRTLSVVSTLDGVRVEM